MAIYLGFIGVFMIISASRRTDIPAFYSDWFMNQIRQGEFIRKNPMTGELYKNSAKRDDVDVIVFWTRNAHQMMKKGHIKELQDMGYNFYFQYTITGYTAKSPLGLRIDGSSPHPLKAIEYFNELAEAIGPEKVIYRLDPIVVCDQIGKEEIVRLYDKISSNIHQDCMRSVISFLDVYDNVGKNMESAGFNPVDLLRQDNREQLEYILQGIKETSSKYGRQVFSCAESINLGEYGILPSKCIDADYIRSVFGVKLSASKDPGQRKACGCAKSIDVGQYNTCVHGCAYCYATQDKAMAIENYKSHQPDNGLIIPEAHLRLAARIL